MFILFQGGVLSQASFPTSVTFTTQHQINSFQFEFPGCTFIEGDVSISGPLIDDLAGLATLTHIGGDLRIGSSSIISFYRDLTGLNNLESIGGSLEIKGNGSLLNLSGLERLTTVEGDIVIENNPSLLNLSAMGDLAYVGGDITINNNEGLRDLSGLEGLISLDGSLTVSKNPSLISLQGLDRLSHVAGRLEICSNDALSGMEGLAKLEYVGDTLSIDGNRTLFSLSGLEELAIIEGGLSIGGPAGGNDALVNLAGLENVHTLHGPLSIENNESLVSLEGIGILVPDSITTLSILNNPSLATCETRSISNYLTHPGGKVEIYNNAEGCDTPGQVADRSGITLPCLPEGTYNFHCQQDINLFPVNFPGCSILSGDVIINGEDITSLQGLSEVTYIDGNFIIYDNDMLTSLTGLENLAAVEGGIFIGENGLLTGLEGLDNLQRIGEFLQIDFNENLAGLEGLQGLRTAGTMIHIEGNRSLEGLDGLWNLDASSLGYLIIINNFNLEECSISGLCTGLETRECDISIYNNGTGCNSLHEVQIACRASWMELKHLNDICAYSIDPATGIVTFDFVLDEPMEVQLVIYDWNGKLVSTPADKTMDAGLHEITWQAAGSSTGIYFYSLTAGRTATTGELLVSRQ